MSGQRRCFACPAPTVERVVRSATDKLDAETTTHAVATALRLRLFE